jgi:serine/threonine protein kinase
MSQLCLQEEVVDHKASEVEIMKPSLSTESDEGSTLNVQHHEGQQQQQQQQPQPQQPRQQAQNLNPRVGGTMAGSGGGMNSSNNNLIHTIDQKSNKKQAWFHQPDNRSSSANYPGNEAFIEAQVLRLTDECRLFQEQEQKDNNSINSETTTDNPTTNNSSSNSISNSNSSSFALFHRHEIQTSWNMLGNGAFSEVYSIQKFYLLDEAFVDVKQREAREKLRNDTTSTGGGILGQQCLQLEGTLKKQNNQMQRANNKNPKQQKCQQYVVKHLRRDLLTDRKKFIHAAGDLVMEAMYLSKLNHPNIIKLRGCAVGGSSAYSDGKHDGFFIVLDRLDSTLSQKIQEWKQYGHQQQHQQQLIYSNRLIDFRDKLDIAYQIASALEYLHGKDIVYRDLKPDNIGLVIQGSKTIVQLFDFGLCREIPEANPTEDKVFHMSGVGTRRYMSPEVYLGQYYNVKADVYSWSMVFHSMITLQRPFEMYDSKLHKLLVCQEGIRPTIYKEWPQPIQQLLRQGWAAQSSDRPSMKEICSTIESLFVDIGYKYQYHSSNITPDTTSPTSRITTSSNIEDDEIRDFPSSTSSSSSTQSRELFPTRATFEKSITDFVESWTQHLCSGSSNDNNNNGKSKRSNKKSLLRTLEAHLMADTAGGQLVMLKDHHHPYYHDRLGGGTDYPHVQHLRSSFL